LGQNGHRLLAEGPVPGELFGLKRETDALTRESLIKGKDQYNTADLLELISSGQVLSKKCLSESCMFW
jgi:hypothetical protein